MASGSEKYAGINKGRKRTKASVRKIKFNTTNKNKPDYVPF